MSVGKKTDGTNSWFIFPTPTPNASNNLAEYTALFLGLKWCLEHKITELHVIGDSKLVIMQMKGCFKIKKGTYVKAALETIKLRDNFKKITFEHVKRELNTEADELSAIVIDGYNSKTDKLSYISHKKETRNRKRWNDLD